MRGDTGFTLIEVLAALVVAGLIAAVLLPGLNFAAKRERDAVERIEAFTFAEAQLQQLALEPIGSPTDHQGRTARWHWSARLVLEPAARSERLPARLRHIRITVSALPSLDPIATLSLDHIVATHPQMHLDAP